MNFTYIDEKEAPVIPNAGVVNRRAEELVEILNGIPKGSVARIYPDGQTQRGLRSSIGRVSSRRGLKMQAWVIAGDESVYVKRS
jgi:hypothetical protein